MYYLFLDILKQYLKYIVMIRLVYILKAIYYVLNINELVLNANNQNFWL